MQRHVSAARISAGLTLLELVITLGIIVVLGGIVFAGTGPARERTRQAACISNLHQLGVALALYRQDYGGSDRPGWPDEMGFPPGPGMLILAPRPGSRAYVASPSMRIGQCANAATERRRLHRWFDYGLAWWGWGTHRNPRGLHVYPSFPRAVQLRGDEIPVFYDGYHRPGLYPGDPWFYLVLRLNGRVSTYTGPFVPTWQL